MVLDHFSNREFYCKQHSLFTKAFAFLQSVKESDFDNSKVEIDGENCFALFYKGEGKGADKIVMEAHKKYIDIQYVFKGSDVMGFKPLLDCNDILTAYIEKDDYALFNNQPDTLIVVKEGNFTIFYPTDAHAPLLGKEMLWKVVVKVKV
ncbi:MAG: YhcH/YjgK/YiaL family protein [Bacteroidetes bacterium]|nr:YhcH/YjgK/YiaL family protein [Bacteroidota bacterium]